MILKFRIALIVGLFVLGSGMSHAQSLPPEVTTPYVAYTEALEAGQIEAARDAARQAWQAADQAGLDTLTLATLSDNYASLAMRTGQFEDATEAYSFTAELLEEISSDDGLLSETWLYAAHSALSSGNHDEAGRYADRAGDLAENAGDINPDAQALLIFNSRAIQASANWSNTRLRPAHTRAVEAMQAAEGRDFTRSSYYPLLSFVLGATHALLEQEDEAAYWLTVAYHYFESERHALLHWSQYARGKLDVEQREALLERLANTRLPEIVLNEETQAEADAAEERETRLASGELVDVIEVARQEPRYPRNAAVAGAEGTALLQYVVNEDGRTEDIEVIISIPYRDFGEAGVRAVRRWEFTPAMENGEPIRREGMVIEFNFVLGQ
jgi:TonB family protein